MIHVWLENDHLLVSAMVQFIIINHAVYLTILLSVCFL